MGKEDDKSKTEIAMTCNGQEKGEFPGGAGVLVSVELDSENKSATSRVVLKGRVFDADQEGDRPATGIAKTYNDLETSEFPGVAVFLRRSNWCQKTSRRSPRS